MDGRPPDPRPAGPPTPVEETACLLCGGDEPAATFHSRVQLAPATGERFRFVRCGRCGLVYLDPRPAETAAGLFYPPGYLPHRGPDAWGRWKGLVARSLARMDRRRVRWVLRHRPLDAACAVLDVGCGRPTFLRLLRNRTGALCVGLDPDDDGWRGVAGGWNDLRLVQGTVLPALDRLRRLAPAGFHAVTLWHALEHEYRPLETLRALRRLAAPGAVLLVEVPDGSSVTARLHGPDWAGLHTPRHTAVYEPATLAEMVRGGGWSVERSYRHGTLDPFVIWWLGRRARRGDALEGTLEARFPGFLAAKLAGLPVTMLQRWIPLGIQVVVARAT